MALVILVAVRGDEGVRMAEDPSVELVAVAYLCWSHSIELVAVILVLLDVLGIAARGRPLLFARWKKTVRSDVIQRS